MLRRRVTFRDAGASDLFSRLEQRNIAATIQTVLMYATNVNGP